MVNTRALLLLALVLCSGPTSVAQTDAPKAAVMELQESLIRSMRDTDSFDARYRRLAAVMDETFDMAHIAKLALGRHWRDLDSRQQAAFTARLRELSIATFVNRFSGHVGASFGPLIQKPMVRGGVVVESELKGPKADPILFSYQLHAVDGRWRIINIVVDGISDLALKRAEYNTVMEESGFVGLMNVLEQQLAGKQSP
ncbi:MAG: transporter [Gammaproteobacteria bacterium]|nr:transporter [Gammaproteobacteria bacterium]